MCLFIVQILLTAPISNYMSSMPRTARHLNLTMVGTCVCMCVCACVCHDQWSLFCECVHISVIIPVAASLHYLLPGVHGDGDITNTENLLSLQEHVFKGTEGQGVHFVMGDGVSRRCGGGVAGGVVGVWQEVW